MVVVLFFLVLAVVAVRDHLYLLPPLFSSANSPLPRPTPPPPRTSAIPSIPFQLIPSALPVHASRDCGDGESGERQATCRVGPQVLYAAYKFSSYLFIFFLLQLCCEKLSVFCESVRLIGRCSALLLFVFLLGAVPRVFSLTKLLLNYINGMESVEDINAKPHAKWVLRWSFIFSTIRLASRKVIFS